jgi:hypothetical protein
MAIRLGVAYNAHRVMRSLRRTNMLEELIQKADAEYERIMRLRGYL